MFAYQFVKQLLLVSFQESSEAPKNKEKLGVEFEERHETVPELVKVFAFVVQSQLVK